MVVKEMQHLSFMQRPGLTKFKSFFRVLESWCHCDFRKMEALKVNKSGLTYCTGTQAAQALLFFSIYMQAHLTKHVYCRSMFYKTALTRLFNFCVQLNTHKMAAIKTPWRIVWENRDHVDTSEVLGRKYTNKTVLLYKKAYMAS